jgi:hypothetical protein
MRQHGFGNLFTDAHHGIQRCHRLLENHRDRRAAQLANRLVRVFYQAVPCSVSVAKNNLTGDPRLGWQKAHERQRRHGLSRSRLPHQPENFSGGNREGNITNRERTSVRA